ncbi:MAG: preprotein translocase subunit YajC [Myxococcota bacterium]
MFPQLQQVAVLLVAQEQAQGGGIPMEMLLMFATISAIFYFIYIRPTAQDRKKHESLLEGLKRGDEVVLQSGIIGKVADISNKTIHLELARNVKLEVLKTAVARRKADLDLSSEDKSESSKTSKK